MMKTEEPTALLSSTKDLSPSSIIRRVKKEEKEKELEGDDDNKGNGDVENNQWIEIFENIINNDNLDGEVEANNDGDYYGRNEGSTAGRSSSSITIKTEEKVPDSISSKSSMIKMEEEVDEEVFTSIIKNTRMWGDGTITGGATACEDQQQVKREGNKKKEEEAVAMAEKEDGNDKGYESWTEGISPNTNDTFQTVASTNHCVRRKFNSDNNKDDDDVHADDVHDNVDDERKPPPKKKIRVLTAVEGDSNSEADEDHIIDTDYGDYDGDGTSSKIIQTESKYTNKQINIWNKMFRRFVVYKEQHGNTNNPRSYKEDPQLGLWIRNQRTSYRNNKLSKYRMDLLLSIGFVLDPWHATWMEMYQKLIAYKKQHNTTSVPQYYKEDPKLAIWVDNQRQCYKKKELSIERINYLESIGFVWKVRFLWIETYERLVAYKYCHNQSMLVPKRYTEDPSLGVWVNTQRVSYNKGKLSEKRIELLNSIDFVWSVKAGR